MRAVSPRRPRRDRLLRLLRRLRWPVGVPALLIALALATVAFGRSQFGEAIVAQAEDRLIDGSAALGFVVSDVRVEGREITDRDTILDALGAERGTPILAVSPQRTKQRLEALAWVRSAIVERRLPDMLYVRLVERKPLAVWQHGGKLELIDRDGNVIPVGNLAPFARLPTVIGEDAPANAAALLDLLASQPDLAARVTAATRVGGRRWNLRLDNAIDVLLPEDNIADAWVQLARLEHQNGLLRHDIQAVDLRLPDRLVLRVAPEPAKDPPAAKKGRPPAKNT